MADEETKSSPPPAAASADDEAKQNAAEIELMLKVGGAMCGFAACVLLFVVLPEIDLISWVPPFSFHHFATLPLFLFLLIGCYVCVF